MIFTAGQPQLQKMAANILIGNSRSQVGFTYMGLLMVLAISSIAMAVVGIVWHKDMQREREKELKFIGESYKKAIGSYYESKVNGAKQFPEKLDDLLLDTRFPTVKRHVRKLYADPFNKKLVMPDKSWGLELQQGRIVGVYSLSEEKVIQQDDKNSNQPIKYSAIKFIYVPTATSTSTVATQSIDQLALPESSSAHLQLPEAETKAENILPNNQIQPDASNETHMQIPETLNNIRSINAPPITKP